VSSGIPSDSGPVVLAFADELVVADIVLRTPVHDDVPILAVAFADPVLGGEAGLPPLGEEQLHAVLDDQLPQWRASGQLVPYAIVDRETGELLGGATLRQLDATRQSIEIGYWLFERARGRGVATRVVMALLDWLFGERRLPGRGRRADRKHTLRARARAQRLRPGGRQATLPPPRGEPRRRDPLLAPERRHLMRASWSMLLGADRLVAG
jgi:GNAT superfamily N-acetyltransferase